MSGLFAFSGPINFHVPEDPAAERLPIDMLWTCLNPDNAFRVACIGMSFAGYARWA
jgi:hypothetical protein